MMTLETMKEQHKTLIRTILALLLIALMSAASTIEVLECALVPEVSALSVGLWVQNKQAWRIHRWQTLLLLPVIALVAVLAVRYVPDVLPLRMAVIFIVVAALLMLFHVTLTPAFAVGLLPVMLGTATFIYPLAVLVMASLLTLGQYLLDATGLRQAAPLQHAVRPTWSNVLRWCWLLVALLPLIVVSDEVHRRFIIAPPLVVTFVELCNSKGGFRGRPWQTGLMLVLAAAAGGFSRALLCGLWGLPVPVVTIVAEVLVFVMFAVWGKRFAPAAAMALIPFVVPAPAAVWQPLYTAMGAAYVMLVAYLFFIRRDRKLL